MKSITLANGHEWACNKEGYGLFDRRNDGTWAQHTGTCQTPHFRTAQQFSRWLHKRYRDSMGESLPRMIESLGW